MTPTTLLSARADAGANRQPTSRPSSAPMEGLSLVSPAWSALEPDDASDRAVQVPDAEGLTERPVVPSHDTDAGTDAGTDTDEDTDVDADATGPAGVPVGLGLPVVRSFMTPEELEAAAWQDRALCSQTDPEAFFPEKGGSTREAKRVCLGCEVRVECLEYALAHDERFGIWGGLSERERRRVKRAAV